MFNSVKTNSKKMGKQTIDTYKIGKKGNEDISTAELKKLTKTAIDKYGANNVCVRGLNINRWNSFKAFGDEDIDIQEYEDYYQNKIADTSKFNKLFQLEIVIRK